MFPGAFFRRQCHIITEIKFELTAGKKIRVRSHKYQIYRIVSYIDLHLLSSRSLINDIYNYRLRVNVFVREIILKLLSISAVSLRISDSKDYRYLLIYVKPRNMNGYEYKTTYSNLNS